MLVNEVNMELACITPFGKVDTVMHHGESIIMHSFDATM